MEVEKAIRNNEGFHASSNSRYFKNTSSRGLYDQILIFKHQLKACITLRSTDYHEQPPGISFLGNILTPGELHYHQTELSVQHLQTRYIRWHEHPSSWEYSLAACHWNLWSRRWCQLKLRTFKMAGMKVGRRRVWSLGDTYGTSSSWAIATEVCLANESYRFHCDLPP